MINLSLIIYLATTLFSAIILIWITNLAFIEKRKIFPFLPFFIIGLAFCVNATLVFFKIYLNWVWLFLESIVFIMLVWILMLINSRYAK